MIAGARSRSAAAATPNASAANAVSLGTQGVLSFLVGERTPELGIRLALGAMCLPVVRCASTRSSLCDRNRRQLPVAGQ